MGIWSALWCSCGSVCLAIEKGWFAVPVVDREGTHIDRQPHEQRSVEQEAKDAGVKMA
ncbi:hypothetical protein PAXRUDRAFT_824921 [Paxillus rubicundulus Ve08.2h10]|uniref:Uncharacterized protein n=1 Tax=Paxillus rubicundulus Ve08.2h10 TaxID=930991 RepID=A0A0D0E167_9AGAM|nr:hypothetical protein PAXRUDRAFT_824921 [Paxillus rubicundulus Ve08.2h10]